MPAALVPLANLTLGSAQATVTFSGISQSYRDLYCVISASTSSVQDGTINLQFNADSGTNYSYVNAEGNGASVASAAPSPQSWIVTGSNVSTLTDVLSTTVWQILDYSATDKHKSVLIRGNVSGTVRGSNGTNMVAGRWANTAAITSCVFLPMTATNFAAGSSFALYGIVG